MQSKQHLDELGGKGRSFVLTWELLKWQLDKNAPLPPPREGERKANSYWGLILETSRGLSTLHFRVGKNKSLYPPGTRLGTEQALIQHLLNVGSIYSLLIYLVMVQKGRREDALFPHHRGPVQARWAGVHCLLTLSPQNSLDVFKRQTRYLRPGWDNRNQFSWWQTRTKKNDLSNLPSLKPSLRFQSNFKNSNLLPTVTMKCFTWKARYLPLLKKKSDVLTKPALHFHMGQPAVGKPKLCPSAGVSSSPPAWPW